MIIKIADLQSGMFNFYELRVPRPLILPLEINLLLKYLGERPVMQLKAITASLK